MAMAKIISLIDDATRKQQAAIERDVEAAIALVDYETQKLQRLIEQINKRLDKLEELKP